MATLIRERPEIAQTLSQSTNRFGRNNKPDPRLQLFAGLYDVVTHIKEDGTPVTSNSNYVELSADGDGCMLWQQTCEGMLLPTRKLKLVCGPIFHDASGRMFEVDATLSKLRIDSAHVFEGVPSGDQLSRLEAILSGRGEVCAE